jgi:hypothetical protein
MHDRLGDSYSANKYNNQSLVYFEDYYPQQILYFSLTTGRVSLTSEIRIIANLVLLITANSKFRSMGTFSGLIKFSCPNFTKSEGLTKQWNHAIIFSYSLMNVCYEFQNTCYFIF